MITPASKTGAHVTGVPQDAGSFAICTPDIHDCRHVCCSEVMSRDASRELLNTSSCDAVPSKAFAPWARHSFVASNG